MPHSSQRQGRRWTRGIALGLSSMLALAAYATPTRAQELFDETKNTTTLFAFDDHSIPFTQNLVLEMRKPEKHSTNPVVPRGKAGDPDNWAVQFYGSIVKVDGKYRMWYAAASRGKQEAATNQVAKDVSYLRVAYAESDDGVKWTKPNLGLVEYAGNKDNNLVAMDRAYQAYFDSSAMVSRYGTDRIRVLTITTTAQRAAILREATEAAANHGQSPRRAEVQLN